MHFSGSVSALSDKVAVRSSSRLLSTTSTSIQSQSRASIGGFQSSPRRGSINRPYDLQKQLRAHLVRFFIILDGSFSGDTRQYC